MSIVITSALLNTAMELCAEVEQLAPYTKPKRNDVVDLTRSTLAVKAERLRGVMRTLGVEHDDVTRLQSRLEEATATASSIVELTRTWLDRTSPTGSSEALARTVLDRGELLVTFLRRESYGVLPRESS